MVRSVLSNWFGLVVSGAISFFLTPILIHSLGAHNYGIWVLVASLLDYYGLLDIGMRTALFRFVARFRGADQRAALNTTVVTGLAITVGLGLLLVILTPLLILLLPGFFGIVGSERRVFQWLIALVAMSLAVTFPARVLGTYLCGLQRFDRYNLGAIVSAILRAGLLVAILHWGYGIVAIAGISLTVGLFSLFFHWGLVRWTDPHLSFNWRETRWERIRELGSYGFYVFLNFLGEYLRSFTDAIVIARILNVALIAPFSIATRLMEYFKSVMSAAAGPLLGVMSELDGQGRERELEQYFLATTKYMALGSLFLGSLLLLDGKALIRLWLGEGFAGSYPLVLILATGYVVSLGQYPSQLLVFARAQHRPLAILTLAEGVANLLLSIHWGSRYGLVGVALGTAVPMLAAKIVVQPWYALRVLKLPARRYVGSALARPLVVCGSFVVLCGLPVMPRADGDFLHFLGAIGWQTLLFGLFAYALGLTPSERRALWGRRKAFVAGLDLVRAK